MDKTVIKLTTREPNRTIKIIYNAEEQEAYFGNLKIDNTFHFKHNFDVQIIAIYLEPDIVPQGTIAARFALNMGAKK